VAVGILEVAMEGPMDSLAERMARVARLAFVREDEESREMLGLTDNLR